MQPRWSVYLDTDTEGEFIVNAQISQYYGISWDNATDGTSFVFSINLASDNTPLVQTQVAVNSTDSVFSFDLSQLTARLEPYEVVLYGAFDDGDPTETTTAQLYYLPDKTNGTGSVARIDNLSGGIYFKNAASDNVFEPLLAYGYYSSADGFLAENNSQALIDQYVAYGLNAMTPLVQYPDGAAALDYMNQINLPWMEDLRESFMNLTWVEEKVNLAKDSSAIFSYWLSDESDGWQYPFNATDLGTALIKQLDPYHPVAVVLNCQDYYFGPYTQAVDIIMEDVYPIGINSTFSKWGTACNTTLGDCGCDNCEGIPQDVSSRLDDLHRYEEWLGFWRKTKIHNPQSFHGEDYWFRDPSVEEEWVMNALAFNHGAKSIISWVYPASEDLNVAHGQLAKVVTKSPVVDFIVGKWPTAVDVPGYDLVDVSYWVVGTQMLVCIVNGGYVDIDEAVTVDVPNATTITSTAWGNVTWGLASSQLSTPSLPALATSMLILDLLQE